MGSAGCGWPRLRRCRAVFGQVLRRLRSVPLAPPSRGPGLLRLLGAVALVGLAVTTASAQTLTMRSGEHASFTRLTLPLPPGQSWQLGRTEDGYGLRLPGSTATLATGGVFARIPRSRLSALRPAAGGIDLLLACDCHAIAFEEGDLLVIDLRDGPPPAGARFESRLAGPVRPASMPRRPAFDWTRRFVAAERSQAMPPSAEPVRDAAGASGTMAALATEAARAALVRQFARAVAQGLIGADLPAPPADEGVAAPHAAARDRMQRSDPADPMRNLRIEAETAVDRARRGTLRPGLMPDGGDCLPGSLLALPAWGDGSPAAAQIARRRAALLGEFDAAEAQAVGDLARLYLHLGFGAEARALLAALPVGLPEAPVLSDLARLIDEAVPIPGSQFAGMEGCDGAAALWAVLAAPVLTAGDPIDRAAVLRHFSDLPLWLRRHLGPPLARRFLALDDGETARRLRNSISRAAGDHGPGLDLMDAGLAMAEGQPEEADATLAPVVAGHSPEAGEALAMLVEARIQSGLPIDAATADSVVVMARERRGTPLGARLARLEALSLAATGRFDAAFAVRDRLARAGEAAADRDAAQAASALMADLVALLTEGADDIAFLSRVFVETGWREGSLPAEVRRPLAARLIDTGFPEAALQALPADGAATPEDLALAARSALALADARGALRLIAGQTGAEAAGLRAEALVRLGEHRAAALAYLDAGDPASAARAAWLGGDWQRLAALGEGAAARLAAQRAAALFQPGAAADGDATQGGETAAAASAPATIGDPPPAAADSDPPLEMAGLRREEPDGALARSRALLAASAEARRLATELLAEHPPPQP